MNDTVTVMLTGEHAEATLTGVDLIGFEAFAAAGPGREFEFGGPFAYAFNAGDRVTVTIPEYEYTSPARVTVKRSTLIVPDGPEYDWRITLVERPE